MTLPASAPMYPRYHRGQICRLGFIILTAATPLTVHADLKPLDETSLAGVTGQAGITIELETRVNFDRLSWTDEGTVNVNGFRLSGHNDSVLDNTKFTIDIAGDGEFLDYGFSEFTGGPGKQFNSGDLVIHMSPTDPGTDYLRAIDFELAIDSVETTGAAGSATMFSDILLQGYLGPTDLVIRNGGTSLRTLANGNTVSGSELQFETHFEISDGHLNWDLGDLLLLFNFAGVRIEGLQIHNRRGNDTAGHYGMASVSAKLSKGTSAGSGKEGLSVHEVDFRADIDMPVFSIGGSSIGTVQFTDFVITDTSLLIYGH